MPKNSKMLKNDGQFRIPHPQISLKQFSKMIKDFYKTIKLKKLKNGQISFFYILQLPHTVISNSENMTHPNMYVLYLTLSSTDNCLWSVVYKSGGYITERYICVLILTLSSTDSCWWSGI